MQLFLLLGSIYQHSTFFGKGYLFYMFFVDKNNALQYRLKREVVSLNLSHSVATQWAFLSLNRTSRHSRL